MPFTEPMPGFRVTSREDKVDGQEYKREYQVHEEDGHKVIHLGQAYYGPYYPWYCGEPCPHPVEDLPPTWCVCYSPVVPPDTCSAHPNCVPGEDSGCIVWKTTSCSGGRCYWKLFDVIYEGGHMACYCVYEYVYDDCDV